MLDVTILHDLLKNQCPDLHLKRLSSLMAAVGSLLDGQQLSLTELGRNMPGDVAAKHNIKRIDRLLGNRALHQERLSVYCWHSSTHRRQFRVLSEIRMQQLSLFCPRI